MQNATIPIIQIENDSIINAKNIDEEILKANPNQLATC